MPSLVAPLGSGRSHSASGGWRCRFGPVAWSRITALNPPRDRGRLRLVTFGQQTRAVAIVSHLAAASLWSLIFGHWRFHWLEGSLQAGSKIQYSVFAYLR